MTPSPTTFLLAFRAILVLALVVVAVRGQLGPEGRVGAAPLFGFLPALVALVSTLFLLERRPAWRPFAGLAWVLVFDLAVMGLLLASSLTETAEPELTGFVLLGLVVAVSRDLLAGVLAGGLAAVGFTFLAIRHGLATSPLDPILTARATLLLAAGVFTGFLSREAEQERTEREAETSELRAELAALGAHLRDVLACVASGVLVTDDERRVRTYNRAAERILGLPAHRVLGRPIAEVEGLEAIGRVLGLPPPDEADDGLPAPRQDVAFTRPDGREIRIGYALTPLENLAARRLGSILVFQDVTLLRDYEARLLRQEQLAAVGRLVSGIAHEFGNLLGGAQGHVELARQGGPEDAVEVLPIVHETLGRALVTVEHLLRFARGAPIHLVPGVALGRVAEGALHLLQVEVDRRGVPVDLVVDPATPAVQGDATQLEQVVVNLVINALHAVGGRSSPRIALRVAPTAPPYAAAITVEDSGPGIPPELTRRVFEPFFTTKGPLGGSAVPGTGLGLSVALGVVEAHGGTLDIDVSPTLGGARFTLRLPSTPGEPDVRSASARYGTRTANPG